MQCCRGIYCLTLQTARVESTPLAKWQQGRNRQFTRCSKPGFQFHARVQQATKPPAACRSRTRGQQVQGRTMVGGALRFGRIWLVQPIRQHQHGTRHEVSECSLRTWSMKTVPLCLKHGLKHLLWSEAEFIEFQFRFPASGNSFLYLRNCSIGSV